MKTTRLATMCVIWIHGTIACGSATSDPIGGAGAHDGGNGGATSSNGGASSGSGGGGTGGASANGGTSNGGTSGASNNGGTSAGGSSANGGSTGTGGKVASGGTANSGGSSATGGATGDAGVVVCTYVHPNVNGASRTCNSGFCYCSGTDGCYAADTASSCCKEQVVCGPGAQNPVATIYHPGTGETRAANVDIPFSGVGTDPQDGALSGASLVWTSSALASLFGTGTTFNASLPAGVQIITLTVTDSNSNTGTDTITLNIQ